MGYHRAGFDVSGIDIVDQPRYPFDFEQGDALEAFGDLAEYASVYYDAIHASPPCQAYTKAQRLRGNDHPNLITATRDLLQRTGLPYVIENVEGAHDELIDPVLLCGGMFGLRVYRHRLFETNFPMRPLWHPKHWLQQVKMGRPPEWDQIHQPVGNFSGVDEGREAMEMPWANRDGLREAIPPAYTEHVGGWLMHYIQNREVAA